MYLYFYAMRMVQKGYEYFGMFMNGNDIHIHVHEWFLVLKICCFGAMKFSVCSAGDDGYVMNPETRKHEIYILKEIGNNIS